MSLQIYWLMLIQAQYNEDEMKSVLSHVVKLIMSEQTQGHELTKELQNALLLVSSIERALHLPDLALSIINLLHALAPSVFLNSPTSPSHSSGHFTDARHCSACPFLVSHSRSQLRHDLAGLFLKATLVSSKTTKTFNADLITRILKSYGEYTASKPIQCPHRPILENTSRLSLFETAGTLDELPTSMDWRDHLRRALAQSSAYQHQSIIRTVEHVCRDLERRCEEVEKPLREEQARWQGLQNRFDEDRQHYESLQMQVEEVQERLIASDSRKREVDGECEHLRQQLEEMTREMHNAKQQHRQEKEDAAAISERTAAAARKQDLIYLETIKCKDEALLELETVIAVAKAHSEDLSTKLTTSTHDQHAKCQRLEDLSNELRLAKNGLFDLGAVLSDKDKELLQLSGLNKSLEKKIDDANEETRNDKDKYDLAIEKLQNELTDIRHEHKVSLRMKDGVIQQMHEGFREILSKRDEEIRLLEEESLAAAQAKAKKVTDLEKRNADLRRRCQERDQEVTRIREASSKFLGVMGIKRARSSPRSPGAESRAGTDSSQHSISTASLDQDPMMPRMLVRGSLDNKRSKIGSEEPHPAEEVASLASKGTCTLEVSRKTLGLLDPERQNAQRPRYHCHPKRRTTVSHSGFVSGDDRENRDLSPKYLSDNLSSNNNDPYGSTASL